MITAIELSQDKHIQEYLSLLSDPGFLSRNKIPENQTVYAECRKNVYIRNLCSSARLKSEVKQSVRHNHVAHRNSTFDHRSASSVKVHG